MCESVPCGAGGGGAKDGFLLPTWVGPHLVPSGGILCIPVSQRTEATGPRRPFWPRGVAADHLSRAPRLREALCRGPGWCVQVGVRSRDTSGPQLTLCSHPRVTLASCCPYPAAFQDRATHPCWAWLRSGWEAEAEPAGRAAQGAMRPPSRRVCEQGWAVGGSWALTVGEAAEGSVTLGNP